ncbi:MAG: beta-galactosidase [Armatimonadota bacterium]
MHLLFLLCSMLVTQNPQYYIDLGPVNSGYGMTITNVGDGQNIAGTIEGRKCRMIDRKSGSTMIYVDVDNNFKPDKEVYVTVDFCDQMGVITLQYDAGPAESAYRNALDSYPQTGTDKWRTATFTLRKPAFKNRQNGETDFRLQCSGELAVSKISLSNDPPKGYKPPMNPNEEFALREATKVHPQMEVIQQWQVHEPVPAGQLQDSAYTICKKIGITSLQSYVGWAQLEPEQNKITYDVYDPVVDQIRKHDLKWLPFIITGPYIATPKWFREQHGVDAVCLEHNTPIRIQSIWNPELKGGIRRFLELFKAHYDPSVIEALNFGISGNWGESIYPAGGGFDMQGVHTHTGWWCGDKYAAADYRRWVQTKYPTVDALNKAWKSKYTGFDAVKPFIPKDAPSPRAAVDLGNWYTESMTDYAEYWVKTARELFPTLPIYLCTGGDGQVALGADFGAQSRMCAKYNAGIRITNMDDDMLSGFSITRMVSSATRLYGGYYTTEPGGDNTPKGMAGRVFDIVSGGGRGVYYKGLYEAPDNATMNALVFADFAKYMIPNNPKLTVAAIMPNSSISLDDGQMLGQFLERSKKLRDSLDYEFIDENMISNGLLSKFKAVVMLSGNTLEASTLDKLKAWVEDGGVLFTCKESYPLKSIEGDAADWIQKPYAGKIAVKVDYADGKLAGVKADVGGVDGSLLTSAWHGAEGRQSEPTRQFPDPSYRWTTGSSTISLPIPSAKPIILRAFISVPEAIGSDARILANGIEVTKLKVVDRKWVEAPIPAKAIGISGTVDITFESKTFTPGANDPRQMGIQVFSVQLLTKGADPSKLIAADTLSPQITIDEKKAYAEIAAKLGSGYTVVWPDGWDTYSFLLNKALLTDNAPWKQLSEPLDGAFDNVLACRVGESVYYLNNGDHPITKQIFGGKSISIEPRTLVEVKAP